MINDSPVSSYVSRLGTRGSRSAPANLFTDPDTVPATEIDTPAPLVIELPVASPSTQNILVSHRCQDNENNFRQLLELVVGATVVRWYRAETRKCTIAEPFDIDALSVDTTSRWLSDFVQNMEHVTERARHPEPRPDTRPSTAWYDLHDERAQHRAAVNAILLIDRHLHSADLGPVDQLLRRLEVPRLPINVMIAILNATYPVREQLEARATFVDRVQQAMTAALGSERASRLLASRR